MKHPHQCVFCEEELEFEDYNGWTDCDNRQLQKQYFGKLPICDNCLNKLNSFLKEIKV